MADPYTVQVHFINGTVGVVPAVDVRPVGDEGARSATALYEGKEYQIYNRVEDGHIWYEQPDFATWQACVCAQEQAAREIPYVKVGEARPYQYHPQSGRWYVEVDLKRHDADQGAATALYRVWRPSQDGDLAATKVDLWSVEEESPGDSRGTEPT